MLDRCVNLRVINLTGATKLSGLARVGQQLRKSLLIFEARGCIQLRNDDFNTLNMCQNLRSIDLGACTGLDEGVLTILAGCPRLQNLNLSECSWVTSVAPLQACRYLHGLFLSYCFNLKDISGLGHHTVLSTCDQPPYGTRTPSPFQISVRRRV